MKRALKTNPTVELRRRAEDRLNNQRRNQQLESGKRRTKIGGKKRTVADAQRLLHELQVHQVELEMQNAELQSARDEAEAAVEKYTDLYDFAPVGYFSLDQAGRILESNLTGATLLGVERSRLLRQLLHRFLVPASRPVFLAFLEKVFATTDKQICEISILGKGGVAVWIDLQATRSPATGNAPACCRMAASDITSLKRAEEAQRRLEALAVINRELNGEIVRRRAVEAVLKKSERRQKRLLEQSRHMQSQLRQLSHQMMHSQEEERKRISRELHDEISQILVGINVHLESLVRTAQSNPKGLKRMITRTQQVVEKAVEIVHRFARELRPALLDDLGLIPTLHAFLKDFTRNTGIHVQFKTFSSDRIDGLDNDAQTVLYRVAQQALTNAAQHAQASQVMVRLRKLPDAIGLEIADNGISFEVDRVFSTGRNTRLGLLGMRERVQMVGGNLVIESAPGEGTTVRAKIPIQPNAGGCKPKGLGDSTVGRL